MAKLDSSKSCVDPSFFLTSLTNSLRESGRASFYINTQQDAVEILEHILSESLGDSAVASRTLTIKILTDISLVPEKAIKKIIKGIDGRAPPGVEPQA